MKKLLIFTFLLSLLNYSESWSQSCLPEGITFTSQAQIDSFQIVYPNCKEIDGNVKIMGDDISTLQPLSNINRIGGYLKIGSYNPLLKNFNGLNNLERVDDYLFILQNFALLSMEGLENLSNTGSVIIKGNTLLKNLEGLNSVDSVYQLDILNNPKLEDLSGLESVHTSWHLTVKDNMSLKSLSGLNDSLMVMFSITILNNDSLSSLEGIDNIKTDSVKDLELRENFKLHHCDVLSICNVLSRTLVIVNVENNNNGCNSYSEIIDSCMLSIDQIQTSYKYQSYPNPFSTSTTIKYPLTQPQTVTITFYDSYGRTVDIITEHQQQGLQKVVWTPEGLNEGIYYFRLEAGKQLATGKVVLMK